MSEALRIDNVGIRFGGVQALDDVSLTFASGEFVGLIGPNGAGKTTLIRVVAGALRPDRGRVFLGRRGRHRSTDPDPRAQRPGAHPPDRQAVP